MTLLPGFVRRRLNPSERYGLRLTLFAMALVLVAVPFGWLVSQVLSEGWLVRVDTAAANDLHEDIRESRWLVGPLQVVSFLGKPIFFYLLVTAVCMFLLWRSRRRLVVFLVTTSLGGGLVGTAVKAAVDRPRPSLTDPVATASGQSFPSGHAMTSTVIYGALLLVFLPAVARRWRPGLLVATVTLVGAIGFSRLALGVHYISDVLGGHILGAAWLTLCVAAFSIWREERGGPPVDASEGLEPEDPEHPQPARPGRPDEPNFSVEPGGFEPPASCMPCKRSAN